MNLLSTLFGKNKQNKRKTVENYREELINRQGKEQFKKLMEQGLQVPVVLL